MKDNKNTNTASARTLKAGGYSVVMTAILLAALIFVNLIVNSLPSEFIKLDTSSKKLFTLDTQSEEIIRSVKEDVTIYHVAQSGYVLDELTELLARYSSGNSKINIKTVDPAVSPNFIAQFTDEALEDNSLIVVSEKRVKIVPYGEIVYTTYDNITEEDYYNYYYYGVMPEGDTVFAGENAVTSAIDYVTATDIPKVYALTGHGETALSETYLAYLQDENFEYEELSLIASAGALGDELISGIVQGSVNVPEDADLIFINGPTSDISDSELDAIINFVLEGGNVVVCAGYKTGNLPNMVKLAAALGLDLCGGIVIEGSRGYYTQYAYYLLPELQSHEITAPIADGGKRVLVAYSHAMRKSAELPEEVVSVSPLLLTSSAAVGKADPNATKTYYEDGDLNEQFISAAAVKVGNGKAVWFASAHLADDGADQLVSGANADIFLNSLGWCTEKVNSVSIRTISLSIQPLVITESAANTWLIILCAVIPLAVVGAGFAVWFRRRSR